MILHRLRTKILNMDNQADSFLFVNKSSTSRTLSRSKAREKAEIFRHVQRVRQKHDGRPSRHAVPDDVPIRTFTASWALQDADSERNLCKDERGTETGDSSSAVTQPGEADGATDLVAINGRDSPIQRLTGDGIDPFDSFPEMTQYLPPATGDFPYPVRKARSYVLEYIQSIDVTDFARREMLHSALTRPTVMFSHLTMVVLENEVANTGLGKTLDRMFGTRALRHARQEIQNLQGRCPWDLICLVWIFMFRAQVIPCPDISKLK